MGSNERLTQVRLLRGEAGAREDSRPVVVGADVLPEGETLIPVEETEVDTKNIWSDETKTLAEAFEESRKRRRLSADPIQKELSFFGAVVGPSINRRRRDGKNEVVKGSKYISAVLGVQMGVLSFSWFLSFIR